MTNEEHLLVCLMEECGEVIQAASKCLRFGLQNSASGSPLTNSQEVVKEFADVLTVITELGRRGILNTDEFITKEHMERKLAHIEKYLIKGDK